MDMCTLKIIACIFLCIIISGTVLFLIALFDVADMMDDLAEEDLNGRSK